MDDRRTRKTRRLLREGLAELLTEKSVNKITVKELTEKADIHRSTFYGNFDDIYDLRDHTEDTAFEDMKSLFKGGYDLKEFFRALLQYIENNKKLVQLFFKGKIGHSLIDKLTEMSMGIYIASLRKEGYATDMTDEELRLHMLPYFTYLFAGVTGIVKKWVKGEMPNSIDDLAEILYNLAMQIGDSFLTSLEKQRMP